MTGPDIPRELRHRVTRAPRTWASPTQEPRPTDGRPDPAQVPLRSAAHPPALDHGHPHYDRVPSRRCGAGPCVPAQW